MRAKHNVETVRKARTIRGGHRRLRKMYTSFVHSVQILCTYCPGQIMCYEHAPFAGVGESEYAYRVPLVEIPPHTTRSRGRYDCRGHSRGFRCGLPRARHDKAPPVATAGPGTALPGHRRQIKGHLHARMGRRFFGSVGRTGRGRRGWSSARSATRQCWIGTERSWLTTARGTSNSSSRRTNTKSPRASSSLSLAYSLALKSGLARPMSHTRHVTLS